MASRPGSREAVLSCLLAATLLLTSCPGNGGASGTFDDGSGETYAGSSSSGSGGSSSANFSFDDFINLSNSGNTDALVAMFRDDSASSDGGPEGGEYGMDTLVMSATDIGVPAGGKVMLSISGGDADYEEETEVSDDGMVYFQIPRQRVGSRITVSIAVKRADGSIVRSGSKTMLVTDGCQFSVTLINGSPVVLPARLKSASSINSILKNLGAGSGGAARSFSPSLTPPPEGTETYELSSSGSGVQVLAWLDGETIRYYADGMDACGIVPLPASSNSMFAGCSSLTSIDMSGFDASNVTNMGSMFKNCSNLTSVNLSGWDTSNVTSMNYMFKECNNLTDVDLSGWNTSSMTSMTEMFYNCKSLTSANLSGWDTSKITTLEKMFYKCNNLTSVNLSGWDTSNVTSMNYMFYECKNLTGLDVSGWDTSKVTNMGGMFYNCSNLTSVDVSGWDTSKVTTMENMFGNCGVTSLDLSRWDTSSVTSMYCMFQSFKGTSLNLSGWNTSRVTDMSYMFNGCHGLTSLDASSFDTSSVTKMSWMFAQCSNLQTIYASSSFVTDAVTDNGLFWPGTTGRPLPLRGGAGTTWDWGKDGIEYARIDGGPSAPGYFTAR